MITNLDHLADMAKRMQINQVHLGVRMQKYVLQYCDRCLDMA